MSKRLMLAVCLTALLSILFNTNNSYATKSVLANQKRIVAVPDKRVGKHYCSNFGAISIVGNTLYGIKTSKSDKVTVLYRVSNFSKKNKKIHSWPIKHNNKIISCGHANGMEYYKNYLYIATCKAPGKGSQIIKINKKGKVVKKYKVKSYVTGITYFKSKRFILSTTRRSVKNKKYRYYHIAKLSGGKFKIEKSFYVNTNLSGQDIHYNDGYLYIPTFKSMKKGHVRRSYIMSVNLKKKVKNKKIYPIKKIRIVQAPNKGTTKFEVESVDFYKGKMYFGANVFSKSKCKDAVYRVKN